MHPALHANAVLRLRQLNVRAVIRTRAVCRRRFLGAPVSKVVKPLRADLTKVMRSMAGSASAVRCSCCETTVCRALRCCTRCGMPRRRARKAFILVTHSFSTAAASTSSPRILAAFVLTSSACASPSFSRAVCAASPPRAAASSRRCRTYREIDASRCQRPRFEPDKMNPRLPRSAMVLGVTSIRRASSVVVTLPSSLRRV